MNFALFSENANNVALCLFDGPDGNSVKDYYALDPRVEDGTGRPAEAQLRDMLEQASRLGLNVRMDLVINHTAFDSPPVALHPDWFRRDRDGRIILHPEGAGPAPGPREHRYAATA